MLHKSLLRHGESRNEGSRDQRRCSAQGPGENGCGLNRRTKDRMARPFRSTTWALLLVASAFSSFGPAIQAQAPIPAASPTLRVAVVGQALIKTDLRRAAPVAVEQARRYLQGADVSFTNLETATAPRDAAVTPRSPAARTEPDVLDCLRDMGFNLLSLSNNHAWDLGEAGLRITADEAMHRGFAHAGTGVNSAAAVAPAFLGTPAGRVALIGMTSGGSQLTPDTWATPDHPGVNFLELRKDGTLNPEQAGRILNAVRETARQTPTSSSTSTTTTGVTHTDPASRPAARKRSIESMRRGSSSGRIG